MIFEQYLHYIQKFLERADRISHFSIQRDDDDGVLTKDFLFKIIAVRHSQELERIRDDFKKSRRKAINNTQQYRLCIEAYQKLLNFKLNERTKVAAQFFGVSLKQVEDAEEKHASQQLSDKITEIEQKNLILPNWLTAEKTWEIFHGARLISQNFIAMFEQQDVRTRGGQVGEQPMSDQQKAIISYRIIDQVYYCYGVEDQQLQKALLHYKSEFKNFASDNDANEETNIQNHEYLYNPNNDYFSNHNGKNGQHNGHVQQKFSLLHKEQEYQQQFQKQDELA